MIRIRSRAATSILAIGILTTLVVYFACAHPWRRNTVRVYRIGWHDDPPFQLKDENGGPAGLSVDLVIQGARRRGIQLQWVWLPGSAEGALRNGQTDLWPLITITEERKKFIHFSDPYLQHEHCFLVRSTSPYRQVQDLALATVTHFHQPINRQLLQKILPNAQFVTRPSYKAAIEDVCAQRADAAFVEEYSGVAALLTSPCSGQTLRLVWVPRMETRLGIGSSFAAGPVADEIRAGISDIAQEGSLPQIMARWGYLSPRNLENMNALLNANRVQNRLIAAIAVFALLFVLSLSAAYRIRRQKNRIKRTEQAFRESEQKLRLMADNLTEMVLAFDMNRNLIFANPAVERLTGYTIAEIQQNESLCWLHPEDRPRMLAQWESFFQGGACQDEEYRLISKDGRLKWATATWRPIFDRNGNQIGVQGGDRDITERKHAEQALRESERRFRELLENVSLVAIIIDLTGRISFCNDYALTITGWTRAEVIGHPAKEFLDAEYLRQLAEAIDGTQPAHWLQPFSETAILTKKGERLRIEWSSTPLRDPSGRRTIGFASVGSDVTELQRLRAEAAIREGEARFRSLADTAPAMIWVSGPDKACTFFNKGWLAFTGRTLEQEVGDGWTSSMHPDDMDSRVATYLMSFDARCSFQVEYRLRRSDGEYRWLLDTGVPRYDLGGVFAGYVGACTDITDLKHAQEEDIARQKLESVGRLAGGIAHDFNNLLGGVLSCAELAMAELEDGASPDEELERIRAVAIRGAEIVRQLMIYAGQESAIVELVDVSQVVEDMIELLKVAVSKHASLRTDLGSGLPAIRANPAQVQQLVMNLVTNASEAIGECDGVIQVTLEKVTVDPQAPTPRSERLPEGSYLHLKVSDTGCGMTLETQARVFDPFFTTKFAGHGLGLAVVHGIVRSLGGAINLDSAPGRGTQFHVFLPCVDEPAPASNGRIPPASRDQFHYHAGSVLVVEDEDPLRLAISKMLRIEGFDVLEARDGSAAVDLIREHQDHIGVILLDVNLPGTPSREVFEEARHARPDMKVILTSAYGRHRVDASFPGLRVDYFIRKPYRLRELTELLQDALSAPARVGT